MNEIAKKFNLNRVTIWRICMKEAWGHIPDLPEHDELVLKAKNGALLGEPRKEESRFKVTETSPKITEGYTRSVVYTLK